MKRTSKKLCRTFLPRLLSRGCESPIPRSGSAGARVNCFSISVDKAGEPFLLVDGLENETLTGLEWDGSSYSQESTLPLDEVDPQDIFIRHYYGLATIKYTGIADLVWGRLTGLPYLKVHIDRLRNRFGQFRFDQTRLVTKQRIHLLRLLLEKQFQSADDIIPKPVIFDSMELMRTLYSERWILHPEGSVQHQKVMFYMNSLAETGELSKSTSGYKLTGSALKTIEEFEEQETKHAESVSMQKRMFWLSVVILVLAVVQAGIVKLPVLLDLSSPSSAEADSRESPTQAGQP